MKQTNGMFRLALAALAGQQITLESQNQLIEFCTRILDELDRVNAELYELRAANDRVYLTPDERRQLAETLAEMLDADDAANIFDEALERRSRYFIDRLTGMGSR